MEQINNRSELSQYAEAFVSVRAAKNIFWWLIAAAIVVQLTCFILVNFVGVLDANYTPAPAASATQPVTAESEDHGDAVQASTIWTGVMHWLLPATKFMALVMSVLLVLTLMFAVKLSLLGRLGGVVWMMSAMFWSMILLAIMTPWQQMFGGAVACGATYNLGELIDFTKQIKSSWGADQVSAISQVVYYARFVAYPIVALAVWLAVQFKFAKGYEQMKLTTRPTPTPGPGETD